MHLNFFLSSIIIMIIIIIKSKAALAQLVSTVRVENQLCDMPGGVHAVKFLPVSADIYSNCLVEL